MEYITSDVQYEEQNNPIFHTVVKVSDIEVGKGKGYSKKESHQVASQDALNHINGNQELRERILSAVDEECIEDLKDDIRKEDVVEAAEAMALAELEREQQHESAEG